MPAATRGMDFMGKTSSTVAKLLSVMGELGTLSETSSAGCSSVGSVTLVEAGGEGGLGSTVPKQPSSNLFRGRSISPSKGYLNLAKTFQFQLSHFAF